MAPSLPTPLRVVAGLVGSSLDLLRNLPRELPALGVDLAGRALRVSLRVRQEVATLAVRGDDLLSGFGRAEEKPAWATFDEEPETAAPGAAAAPPPRSESPVPAPASSGPTLSTPPRPVKRPARPARSTVTPRPVPSAPARRPARPGKTTASTNGAPSPATTPAVVAPQVDPHADPLSLSTFDLRELLADLEQGSVQALLTREVAGPARAAYVTLLTNRLTTLQADPSA